MVVKREKDSIINVLSAWYRQTVSDSMILFKSGGNLSCYADWAMDFAALCTAVMVPIN